LQKEREREETKLFAQNCFALFVEMIIMRKIFVFQKLVHIFFCCVWELFRQILDEITHERGREKREAGREDR